MPLDICGYITSFYLNIYISYTAVQTNDTDFTQQVVFVKRKKQFQLHRFVFDYVCLCLYPNN